MSAKSTERPERINKLLLEHFDSQREGVHRAVALRKCQKDNPAGQRIRELI